MRPNETLVILLKSMPWCQNNVQIYIYIYRLALYIVRLKNITIAISKRRKINLPKIKHANCTMTKNEVRRHNPDGLSKSVQYYNVTRGNQKILEISK